MTPDSAFESNKLLFELRTEVLIKKLGPEGVGNLLSPSGKALMR